MILFGHGQARLQRAVAELQATVEEQRTKLDSLRRDYNELDEQLARYVKRERMRERRENATAGTAAGEKRPPLRDPGMGPAAPPGLRGVRLRRWLRQNADSDGAEPAVAAENVEG